MSSDDAIFVGKGYPDYGMGGWTVNGTSLSSDLPECLACFGLFVDIHNNLYCSQSNVHQVMRASLDNSNNTTTIVAGTGLSGSTSNMLHYPYGIFVTTSLELYVADSSNNRIQLFQQGERNAATMPVTGSMVPSTLSNPTGVALDADGYLFIVDSGNHRIVGSGPSGFRCVVGCSASSGSAPNQLKHPQSMSFDRDGNIFVADWGNSRIQKFLVFNNIFGE